MEQVRAAADAAVARTLARAQAQVAELLATARAARLTRLSGMGFSASDLNAVEWAQTVAEHPADKLHMDVQTPASLQLEGVEATKDAAFGAAGN